MENVEKRLDINLVTGKSFNFNFTDKFNDKTVFCEIRSNQTYVIYNKPMYTGFSLLDLSKTVSDDYLYNFIKQQYHNKTCTLDTH